MRAARRSGVFAAQHKPAVLGSAAMRLWTTPLGLIVVAAVAVNASAQRPA